MDLPATLVETLEVVGLVHNRIRVTLVKELIIHKVGSGLKGNRTKTYLEVTI